jgi:hypothetical protein
VTPRQNASTRSHRSHVQGADRPVEWHELQRFAVVPLEVTFYPAAAATEAAEGSAEGGQQDRGPVTAHVMFLDDIVDSEKVVWRLAEVKANSPGVFCMHCKLLDLRVKSQLPVQLSPL